MSSDLQIVVNLKGVFMGKLKEKLKNDYFEKIDITEIKARKIVCHISSIHNSLFYVHDDWLLYDHVFS